MGEQRKASLAVALFLGVTACLFGPAQVYYGNADEFELFFWHAAVWLFPAALLLSAVVALGCELCPARGRVAVQALVFALASCLWLQGSVLSWSYGPLDGSPIQWGTFGPGRAIADALAWISIPAAALLLRRTLGPRLAAAASFMIALELATTLALGARHLGDERSFKRYLLDEERQLEFSSGRNAIVLVLDTFQTGAFERILEERPALAEGFDGFTFYRNATGGFPTTYPSIPLILTGRFYDNTRPIQEFIRDAYRSERSLPRLLHGAGYRVELYPLLAPQTVDMDPSLVSNLRRRGPASWPELALLVRLGAFRMLPHSGKRLLAGTLLQLREVRHLAETLSFVQALESARTAPATQPVLKFLHLSGAHAPFELNEDLQPEALGHDLRAYDRQATGVVVLVQRFLRKLRDLGALEDALIFVVGDHGHVLGGLPEVGTPLVLVKPPGARGPLRISSAPVSLADIPLTAADALGLPAWEDPEARSMLRPEAPDRRRRFLYYRWEHRFWGREMRYLPPMAEYRVLGDPAEEPSWVATGRRFEGGHAVEAVPYAWETELAFGNKPAPGSAPAWPFLEGFGWWGAEATHTWNKGTSELAFPIQPPDRDLDFEATVFPFLAPSIDEQVVTIRANGVEVATWRLREPGTHHARIPRELAAGRPLLWLSVTASRPFSPAAAGVNDDLRRLGVAFSRARLGLQPSPPPPP